MPLNKCSGNMYGWISHTWNPLAGECLHKCSYCYNLSLCKQYPALQAKYTGKPELVEKEMKISLGSGNTVFVGNMTDIFANNVPGGYILQILQKCCKFPDNRYLFQTKNPERFLPFLEEFPIDSIFCITLETNRDTLKFSKAPLPAERISSLETLSHILDDPIISITIEPIMDFDFNRLVYLIESIYPAWVSIGADSKKTGLPEPSPGKLQDLIRELEKITVVRLKPNIDRILGGNLKQGFSKIEV